jgi:hypothetical protein
VVDDHVLNGDQDEEDHSPNHVIATDYEISERLNYRARSSRPAVSIQ